MSTPTDDERKAPTEQDWRAAHQDGGVIFAKVKGSPVPVLLMRGKYGDWSSETKRYRSADIEEVIRVYRWVPAGMQEAWSSEIVADFRRSEVPEPSAEPKHDEHYQNQPQGGPSAHDDGCEADWGSEGQESPCRCAERAQGEPSDAQVDAARDAYYATWGPHEIKIRAALIAAGSVR